MHHTTKLARMHRAPRTFVAMIGASIATTSVVPADLHALDTDTSAIAVRLTGFKPEATRRSPDGTIPVRWSGSRLAWISDQKRCRELWLRCELLEDPSEAGLAMHSDDTPDAARLVRTCAEWAEARAEGRYAASSKDMDIERRFIFADGVLTALAHARPSDRTRFADFDLAAAAQVLLPSSQRADGIVQSPPSGDSEAEGDDEGARDRWTIEGNCISWVSEDRFGWAEPVILGDIDGDGWEDMVVLTAGGMLHGTMRWHQVRAFTNQDDDGLVEITARLPSAFPSEDSGASDRTPAWQAAVARIAPNRSMHLEGECRCCDRPHPLHIEASIDRGILRGSLRCDRMQQSLPLIGALGATSGTLRTRGNDDAPLIELRFDWKLAEGVLSLEGARTNAAGIEATEFRARGQAPSPEQCMRREGWQSELALRIGASRVLLRRGCNAPIHRATADALCLDSNGTIVELVRIDRIEWAASTRHPEDEPASDEEFVKSLASCVKRVRDGSEMLLFDAWAYGASTNNPYVIAIPIRGGEVVASELRVFALATVELRNGIARILTHDLRAGADPYFDSPQQPSIAWEWAGQAWSDE